MSEYPTGTVTFVMTDVEGSTTLWERHAGVMGAAMAAHDALVDAAVAEAGGHVIRPRGEGDSRFVVFTAPAAAVRAAAAIQRGLAGGLGDFPFDLRVRIGIHTGAADWRDGDYYGSAVNRCARVRGLAHGGQTLLSQATAELTRDDLPAGARLVDLGTHPLKGLSRPETVYQLWLPDLPNDFPPLQSAAEFAGNLPAAPTAIIGRQREVAELTGLLTGGSTRLVTLTGPGGTGKTRLCLEVGRALRERFPHGVYFVDLAPITNPALVATTIAHTIGLQEGGDRPVFDNLADYLAGKHTLLLLDNLEQVIGAAPVIAGLLAATRHVVILATSRIPLQVRGEREYPVDTLSVPPRDDLPVAALETYEAVRFFTRQAQAARPAFQLTAGNAAAVAGICRRLDGLPLAIEIAAARVRMLPPAAILKRLDQSLKLLVGGAADLPTRQQTVRNAIDWSYTLLSPDEQTLLARLGVFVGGFTLESAEAVVNHDGNLDVFDGIETLLRNSLVRQVEADNDEPRFDMLLTIRDYALEKLEERGELAAQRSAHAAYFVQQAMAQYAVIYGEQTMQTMLAIEADHDNYRAAISWNLAEGNDPFGAGWIGVFLLWFWYRRGYVQEGREWADRMIRAIEPTGGVPLAMSLTVGGMLALWLGESKLATERNAAAVGLAGATDFPLAIMMSHFVYGVSLINRGLDQEAYGHLSLAAEMFDEVDSAWDKVNTLIHLANAALGLGDPAAAASILRSAMPQAEATGDPWQLAFGYNNLGEVARVQGDYERARQAYERSEQLFREVDAKGDHARLIHTLGYLAVHDADLDRAEALFRDSLSAFRHLGNKRGMAECLAGLAAVAAGRGNAAWAAPLLAAAETQIITTGAAWWPADRVEIERTRQQVRVALGDTAFEAAWARGQALGLDAALAYASPDAPPA